jgi:copper chaperone CopZ
MVIGFILASLLKGKRKTGPILPVIRGQFEATHSLPGRIRFRVPLIEHRDNAQINSIRNALKRIKGIDSVEAFASSGSILVLYDDKIIEPIVVCGILIKLLGLEAALDSQPVPAVDKEMKMIGNAIDHTVYNASGGAFDFTSAAVLLMISLGLYKIIIQKDRSLPSGINLLWWAYVMAKGRKS